MILLWKDYPVTPRKGEHKISNKSGTHGFVYWKLTDCCEKVEINEFMGITANDGSTNKQTVK